MPYIVGSDLLSSMGILNKLCNLKFIPTIDDLANKFIAAGKPFGTPTGFTPTVFKTESRAKRPTGIYRLR